MGDGVADDSAAFQAALDQHTAVHVPAGSYRLDSEVQVKPRRRLHGAGRDVTVIDARGRPRLHLPAQRGRLPDRRRRRQRLVPQLAVRDADRDDHGRHPGVRARVSRQPPAVLRRCRAGRARRCRRLVRRPGRRQRMRAHGHPGRLWRRQRACAARQRHPLALQPDRRQLRRQPTGRSVDQAGRAQHLRRPAAGQPSGPDQQRAAGAGADQRTHGRRRRLPCKCRAPARRSTRWPGPSGSTSRRSAAASSTRSTSRSWIRASRRRAPASTAARAPRPTSPT